MCLFKITTVFFKEELYTMKKIFLMLIAACSLLITSCGGAANTQTGSQSTAGTSSGKSENAGGTGNTLSYWTEDSAAMKSIVSYVSSVTDESSDEYLPASARIAVFDFDGTLYGELYPTYFDEWMMLHRVLHDSSYEAPADIKEYAQASEDAYKNGLPQPETSLSSSAIAAEAFKGMTVDDYRAYVRNFMSEPVFGFENMIYAEGFYLPMISVVEYLYDNGFTIFISSGSERALVRELTLGVLDQWVPSWQIIGSTFSLEATGQGDTDGRKYTLTPEDEVVMEGNLVIKNQQANKVYSIINEIGEAPLLVFGNSSGDLAMAEYALQHGGKGYMLLCDDTERDYGNLETAEKFAKKCQEMGLETISMKNDFVTIYTERAVKTQAAAESSAEAQAASESSAETQAAAESSAETLAPAA